MRELAWEDGANMFIVAVRAVKTTGERGRMDGITIGGTGVEVSKDVVMLRVRSSLVGNMNGIAGRWLSQGLDRRVVAQRGCENWIVKREEKQTNENDDDSGEDDYD